MLPERKFEFNFEEKNSRVRAIQIRPGQFSDDVLYTVIKGQFFDPKPKEIILRSNGKKPVVISPEDMKEARKFKLDGLEIFLEYVVQEVKKADMVTIKRVNIISS